MAPIDAGDDLPIGRGREDFLKRRLERGELGIGVRAGSGQECFPESTEQDREDADRFTMAAQTGKGLEPDDHEFDRMFAGPRPGSAGQWKRGMGLQGGPEIGVTLGCSERGSESARKTRNFVWTGMADP
jgi:hypothetical protein